MSDVRALATQSRAAARVLATLDVAVRDAALQAIAQTLQDASEALFAANVEDLRRADKARGEDQISAATRSRLLLNAAKLDEMITGVRSVAALPDPLGRTLDAIELDDRNPLPGGADEGLHLTKLSVPLGVLAVIFEARPDAVTQIASLAIKSGNSVILKAGREVEATAVALVAAIRTGLTSCGLPADAVSLVVGREAVRELLALDGLVDMVIPRGSKALVEFVQANTRIPVLGHAEGVCHIYVDRAADQDLALGVIDDAKTDYPAACNAVETVLVHEDIAAEFLPKLAKRLRAKGVRIHTTDEAGAYFYGDDPRVTDWHTEWGELAIALGTVDSLDAAIAHIHAHGSSHTESILTEDAAVAERFLREVDAAGVYHNVSTRFADGFRYGFGAEVGISTSKLHARGPVGLEGLTTYKYILRGHGHTAAQYRGADARRFTHRRTAE